VLALTISAIIFVPILCYASYLDVMTRKVPFWIWFLLLVPGVPLCVLEYYQMYLLQPNVIALILPISFILSGVFYLLGKLNLIGGADAFCLMFLSVLIPSFPFEPITGYPIYAIFIISVIVNAILFGAILFLPLNSIEPEADSPRSHIPFVPAITAGFIFAIAFGDIFTFVTYWI